VRFNGIPAADEDEEGDVRIAVIGAGVSGMGSAWLLSGAHSVDVFEAEGYLGGHTNTVDVHVDGHDLAVDTGFMVFNHRTYPNLVGMFKLLGVQEQPSNMSFGMHCGADEMEWSSHNLSTLFAQRRNVLRPEMWSMLLDVGRLSFSAERLLADSSLENITLGEMLERDGYGDSFIQFYLLPMAAAIWSTRADQILDFPAATFLRFCDNHGLLHVTGKPHWKTVKGGARTYVQKLREGISGDIHTGTPVARVTREHGGVSIELADGATHHYDQVVLATHADTSLALLSDPSDQEREILGSFPYTPNVAVLHSDSSFLPRNRSLWASWNYDSEACELDATGLSVTYWLNRLQNHPVPTPVLVTINPSHEPREDLVFRRFDYSHPNFDSRAIAAQRHLHEIQGRRDTWYCGAWQRYGFHEDGILSAVNLASGFGIKPPWLEPDVEPAPFFKTARAPETAEA
jgi:predicted NAD/FAD-binding protein